MKRYSKQVLLFIGVAALLGAADETKQIFQLLDAQQTDAAVALADETDPGGAAGELIRARIARQRGAFREALSHLARLQARHYRETAWIPPALYYEALLCRESGADPGGVSALQELQTLFPDSEWAQKARESFRTGDESGTQR